MVNTRNRHVKRVQQILIGMAIFILAAHILTALLDYYLNGFYMDQIRGIFNLDGEYNFTAFYSGFLLGCCGYFALVNGVKKQSSILRFRWIVMTVLFTYIALDEVLVIHERFAEPIRSFLSISSTSTLYHAWILVALGVAVVLMGIIFFMQPRDPASKFQRSIFINVTVLACVTILLEIVGTKLYFSPLLYQLGPVVIEEMFEIGMVSFMLYRLVAYTQETKLK